MSNDEIVAALRYCQITEHSDCWGCPANIGSAGCLDALHKEAADVLEAQRKRIEELEKKLSSAVHDLRVASECWSCKRNGKCHPDVSVKLPDVCCGNYKWRGATDNMGGSNMKSCGNCANYDRSKMQHTDVCGTCVKCETKYTNWKPIPMTHGDQIRAMSDKELAKLIYEADSLGYCKNLMECVKEEALGDAIPDERCIACALAWLRQPVEEDT